MAERRAMNGLQGKDQRPVSFSPARAIPVLIWYY
jgi:hypothetical protein